MKKLHKVFALAISIAMATTPVYAHQGGLNSYFGHRDNKNVSGLGDYHYHCNQSEAHLHLNKECPYKILEKNVKISFNENLNQKQGFVQNGATLLRLKDVAELLNIQVTYNATTKTVDCTQDGNTFTLNNPIIHNGTTLIKVRDIADIFGFNVSYQEGVIYIV